MSRSVLICAAIVVCSALVLYGMGRLPFCKCGVVSLWSGDIWSNQNSQQLFDPYAFTHVLHGTVLYGLMWLLFGKRLNSGNRLMFAVLIESGWEIFENTDFVINRYREATISLDYYGDSILNSCGDIVAMIAGFAIAQRAPIRATIIGSIMLDAILLALIRDSLAINVIMLIYPVDAIRQWQLG